MTIRTDGATAWAMAAIPQSKGQANASRGRERGINRIMRIVFFLFLCGWLEGSPPETARES
jgi:hypothetical protein